LKPFPATLLFVLLAAGCASAPHPPSRQVREIAEEFYEQRLRADPFNATEVGDERYNDRFTINLRESDRAARRALYEKYRAEFEGIDPSSLDEQSRLTREIFLAQAELELAALQQPDHLLPVHQFGSLPAYFAELGSGAGVHPFRTVKDYDDFLSRIGQFPMWAESAIANMREGISKGIVQPRILIEKTIPQFDKLAPGEPQASIFYTPVRDMPQAFSEADRERLSAAYTKAIRDTVSPTYRRLATFLRDEYLPAARATTSISALPGGEPWYRYLVRRYTTTDLTPEQIHEIGLREVARIHGEMQAIREQVAFQGDLKQFFDFVRNDPRFKYASREDVVSTFRGIKRKVDPELPKLFDILPKADYQVRAVEPFQEATSASYYQPATPDGTRPGVFWVNS
jgi:uncharacterized protein (DUF885 family)